MTIASAGRTLGMAAGFAGLALSGQQPKFIPLAPPAVVALQVFRGKRADLQTHPFQAGPLTLSLRSYHKVGFGDYFDLHVDNPSTGFLEVRPMDLVVVDGLGRQVPLSVTFAYAKFGFAVLPPPFRLAPGAYASLTYEVKDTEDLRLPFKVYFGDQLVGEITSE
jgi:hypothetical protein